MDDTTRGRAKRELDAAEAQLAGVIAAWDAGRPITGEQIVAAQDRLEAARAAYAAAAERE